MKGIRADRALTRYGWQRDIEVQIAPDGSVADVAPATGKADHHVDLLLPAPANLHSHSFQRAMAGLTEARGPNANNSFWTWRRLMYRFLEQLNPDQIEAIAAQVFVEMAEAGYAAVAEFHYLHHGPNGQPYDNIAELSDRIAAAGRTTGFGLTLLPVMYTFGGCDGRPLEGGQMRFGNTADQYADLFEAAQASVNAGPADWLIGTAAHSLRAVDQAGLSRAAHLAQGRPMHMHLAEQAAEVEEVQAHLGARPGKWVLDNMDAGPSHCFIHCTQMTDEETRALAQSGAAAGLCPITESSLGDGIFNGSDYLAAGGAIGFGSDSNIHISLWDELRTLEYSQRLRDGTRAVLATPDKSTGRALFDAAVFGGARAAGRKSGAIAPGCWADLIGVSTDTEFLCNRDGDVLLDSLIFTGGGPTSIRDVWSAGRHIVREGSHLERDWITDRFKSVLNELQLEI